MKKKYMKIILKIIKYYIKIAVNLRNENKELKFYQFRNKLNERRLKGDIYKLKKENYLLKYTKNKNKNKYTYH